jgi:hypothetical protein
MAFDVYPDKHGRRGVRRSTRNDHRVWWRPRGWASASVADGVTLVEIELARRSASWPIKFGNPDPNAL